MKLSVRPAGVALAVVAIQILLVAFFTWPAIKSQPRDLPVVVAGSSASVAAVTAQLEQAQPNGFAVTRVADAASADDALRDRKAYAAFIPGPSGMSVHVASAASPAVASLFTQQAARLAQPGQPAQPGQSAQPTQPTQPGESTQSGESGQPAKPGQSAAPAQSAQSGQPAEPGQLAEAALSESAQQAVSVVDVVPVDPDDPRGAGLASALLPMILTSIAAGAAIFLLVQSRRGRLVGLITFAAAAGLAEAASLQYGLGALPGDYLANAGVLALVTGAIASTVTGLASLIGPAGIGLGALVVFLLGNPLSALNSAPELLPQPWGQIGQLLPLGAGGTLIRSVAYFGGAGGATAAWALATWTVLGIALTLRPGRTREPNEPSAAEAERPATPELAKA
jgi:hypothetical protein